MSNIMVDTNKEENAVWLDLVWNKQSNRVMFAKSGKEFVDILFSFLILPLGTVASLLEKDSPIMGKVTLGSLNSLYSSLEDLSPNLFCEGQTSKDMLLREISSTHHAISHKEFVVNDHAALYIISDQLIVKPFSLNDTMINPTGELETSRLKITEAEVIDLLKMSLLSKTPLTDFFFGKKPCHDLSSSNTLSSCWDVKENIKLRIKLVVKKSSEKLLCAFVDQHFVNMLLSFLKFPLGGVICKLGGHTSLGRIDNLYESITNELAESNKMLPIEEVTLISESAGKMGKGLLKGSTVYLVTSNLVFRKTTPFESIDFLQYFDVEVSDIQENIFTICIEECLCILKASLTSTSALEDGLRHLLRRVEIEENVIAEEGNQNVINDDVVLVEDADDDERDDV